MKQREQIINDYITAYNHFDVDGMVKDFDPAIRFQNRSNGVVNMTIDGLTAFKEQALQANALFASRKQTITSFEHRPDHTQINIDYAAVLAVDLPNGLQKGDALRLSGQSIFRFEGDKIVELTDVS